METTDNSTHSNPPNPWENPNSSRSGRVLAGLIVIAAGVALFLRKYGVVFPDWVFSVGPLLIVIGLFISAKSSFRTSKGIILMIIGGIFLLFEIYPELGLEEFFWPIVIIVAGIGIMISPGRHHRKMRHWKKWQEKHSQPQRATYEAFPKSDSEQNSGNSYLDSTVFFGSVKKNIFSKDFKGGEVVIIFGGTEINLSQAEISQQVILDITQIFGGTKLIVPAHWQVRSEITAFMGGVEDKRPVHPSHQEDTTRVLVLKGTCIFGGIDIKSY